MNKLSRRVRALSIRAAVLVAGIALLGVACGGDGTERTPVTAQPTSTATPDVTRVATPGNAPTELRVAYINLLHPVSIDSEDTIPGDTANERLALVIAELKALDPDVIAVSEATEDSISVLTRELGMEYVPILANPWGLGQSHTQAKALSDQLGFWEGEAILVSRDYAVSSFDIHQVNPRTSLSENRSVGHIVLRGPDAVGQLNVYVTHLTDGTDASRAEQARDIAAWIDESKKDGTVILVGDLGEGQDSATYRVFTAENGYADMSAGAMEKPDQGTCCRPSVLGEQEPLTSTTAHIFAKGWTATSVAVFAAEPGRRADGSPLYASDQNGLFAVFPLHTAEPGY